MPLDEFPPTAAVNAAVQAALNAKVSKTGDTMSGNLAMGGNSITGVQVVSRAGDMAVGPTNDSGLALQANNTNQIVITKDLIKIQSVPLDMNSHLINNVTDPLSAQDVATKNYVDTSGAGGLDVFLSEHIVPNGGETTFSFTGLDGDAAETYLLRYMLAKGTNASFVFSMQFNNTANVFNYTQLITTTSASVASAANSDLLLFGNNSGSSGDVAFGEIIIDAKRRNPSLVASRCMQVDARERHASLAGVKRLIEANWEDQATNITSINFISSVASGFGETSYVRLYKRKKQ